MAIDGAAGRRASGTDKLNAIWFRSHPGDTVQLTIHAAGNVAAFGDRARLSRD